METQKPLAGAWNDIQAYPEKIKFETNKPVTVTFPTEFTEPLEMPSKEGDGVFYIFNVLSDGKMKSISTSSFTLLRSLKTHIPLGGKTLIITKKIVGGKNMFYVETPNGTHVEEVGDEEDDTI